MTDLADGSELHVVRWRRFGHDRLYVNAPDGTRIGWIDLVKGESTLEVEELRADFDRAIAEYNEQTAETPNPSSSVAAVAEQPAEIVEPQADPMVATEPQADPMERVDAASDTAGPSDEPPEQPWTDLAMNQPGEAVATEAKKAFDEAPVRNIAARAFGIHTNERAWRVGSKGEVKVGKQLAKLGQEWRTLHSIPVGTKGSDIDHVAIGPGGVYTINAKHHPHKSVWVAGNTFMVDGSRQPYVRNARHEANRAERLLSEALGWAVPLVGLIAVIGAHEGFTVKEQPRDAKVVVLKRRELAQWLHRRGPVLGTEQVEAIFEAARRSTTWT